MYRSGLRRTRGRPSGRLESEVDRLTARTPDCSVIVARPDRQLVARLQEFTAGR
ncbi:hypothetical protein ACFYQT_41315 [Streptomyces tibetensis]|uniref:Uncharacterized protein n=1 Tax=Streptomyces tibetensis TaxID=2382123 RepID=A0ABW6N9J3_9ACTN